MTTVVSRGNSGKEGRKGVGKSEGEGGGVNKMNNKKVCDNSSVRAIGGRGGRREGSMVEMRGKREELNK